MSNNVMREAERLSLLDTSFSTHFHALDQSVLDAMHAILPPFYIIDPLHLHARNAAPLSVSKPADLG